MLKPQMKTILMRGLLASCLLPGLAGCVGVASTGRAALAPVDCPRVLLADADDGACAGTVARVIGRQTAGSQTLGSQPGGNSGAGSEDDNDLADAGGNGDAGGGDTGANTGGGRPPGSGNGGGNPPDNL